jgi:hypothetical protein
MWIPMRKIHTHFLVLLSFLFVSACATDHQPPLPDDVNSNHLNQEIRLYALPELNDFKLGREIGLYLEYNAEKAVGEITFPNTFNAQTFIRIDNAWVEIQEKPAIRLFDEVVFPNPYYSHVIIIDPDIEISETKIYDVRVYVFGDMKTKAGVQKIGAFVDFKLFP